jgi:hypothetical protein
MARPQDENFEHQDVIIRRLAALRLIAPRRGALEIGSNYFKIDDLIQKLSALCSPAVAMRKSIGSSRSLKETFSRA